MNNLAGCCSQEFCTTYPNEFAESIGNINKIVPQGKVDALWCLAFILVIIVGLGLILSRNRMLLRC